MIYYNANTLVGANRVRIHLSRVKPFVLRVKSIVLRVKTSVLRVKHCINDPFSHELQITLINVITFYAYNKWFYA